MQSVFSHDGKQKLVPRNDSSCLKTITKAQVREVPYYYHYGSKGLLLTPAPVHFHCNPWPLGEENDLLSKFINIYRDFYMNVLSQLNIF